MKKNIEPEEESIQKNSIEESFIVAINKKNKEEEEAIGRWNKSELEDKFSRISEEK